MIAAAIDVGTNSIKLVVGETDDTGAVRILHNASEIARLGENVDASGRLSTDAQSRAIESLARLTDAARAFGAGAVRMAGTSALRDAANRGDFAEMVRRELGVELEVITEEDECRLSYSAVAHDPDLGVFDGRQAVVDVGGGSSELVVGHAVEISYARSLKIGAVRLTERCIRHDPPLPEELMRAASLVDSIFADVSSGAAVERLIGVGGSAVNLARIARQITLERSAEVHGDKLTRGDLERLIASLAAIGVRERMRVTGLDPARADIIVAGAIILSRVVDALNVPEMMVSIRGLRFGLLYEMLSGQART